MARKRNKFGNTIFDKTRLKQQWQQVWNQARQVVSRLADIFGLGETAATLLTAEADKVQPHEVMQLVSNIVGQASPEAKADLQALYAVANSLSPYVGSSAFKQLRNQIQTKLQRTIKDVEKKISEGDNAVNQANANADAINYTDLVERRDVEGSQANKLKGSATNNAMNAKNYYDEASRLVEQALKGE